ncbi:hypothetical protein N7454_005295 [Penicillium verhagenii]|nr:hypothetical protein N7454_005295 [Penicillium verhagenii]
MALNPMTLYMHKDSQYAPTPGYSCPMPASRYGRDSPSNFSDDNVADPSQHDPESPRLLQLPDWRMAMSNDGR